MTIEWKKCQTCKGRYITFVPAGRFHRADNGFCDDCDAMHSTTDEVESKSVTRCPACGEVHIVDYGDRLYEEGEHEIYCGHCDNQYPVRTEVSYTFVSPAMGVKAEESE